MKKTLIIIVFATVVAVAPEVVGAESRIDFNLGAGTGYLIGSLSEEAPEPEVKRRFPTFLDMAFDYIFGGKWGLGLRTTATIEDSVAAFFSPRISWLWEAKPFVFSVRAGPTFCGDPFLFGVEAGASAGIMFNKYIGIEASFTPQFIFVGDTITGKGYLAPILFSVGIKGGA